MNNSGAIRIQKKCQENSIADMADYNHQKVPCKCCFKCTLTDKLVES